MSIAACRCRCSGGRAPPEDSGTHGSRDHQHRSDRPSPPEVVDRVRGRVHRRRRGSGRRQPRARRAACAAAAPGGMRADLRGAPAARPGRTRHRVGRGAQGLAEGDAAVVGTPCGRHLRGLRAAASGSRRTAAARRATRQVGCRHHGEHRRHRDLHSSRTRHSDGATFDVDPGRSLDAGGVDGSAGSGASPGTGDARGEDRARDGGCSAADCRGFRHCGAQRFRCCRR